MDSLNFTFDDIPVAYYRLGRGQPLLMVHGSGPGASSLGNWASVLEPLSHNFEVFAMDLIGFGQSGRKSAPPYFDFPLWVRQIRAMMDQIGSEALPLVGHSLAAPMVLSAAAQDSRVACVATTAAVGMPFTPNDTTWRTWTCPRDRETLIRTLSGLMHDPSPITPAYLERREQVIFAPGYADYFDDMFGGDKSQYLRAAQLSDDTLNAIQCPVLLMHGRNDTGYPATISEQLCARLPQADLHLFASCSHSIAVEHPARFVALVSEFCRSRAARSVF